MPQPQMTSAPSSQWENLLHNLGAWQGSFTRLSPQGEVQEDIPTLITLEGLNHNRTIRQTLQYFAPGSQAGAGEMTQEKVLEYSSLSQSVLCFPEGAFSQGSIHFGPYSEFGAELGFIRGDRRLRLVQLFDTQSQLSRVTLIREYRQHTEQAERPPLTVEQLIGDWQGEAVTLYPDWRSPTHHPTRLSIRREGDRLSQRLTMPDLELASTAMIEGSILHFEQGSYPMQVLLLPNGASCNTPLSIPRGKPFCLEAGWLVEDALRQRMIRSYDDKGAWVSLTLVTECKVM